MRVLMRFVAVFISVLFTGAAHAQVEGPDPIPFAFDVDGASARGTTLTVDVTNEGGVLITVDVQALYNDGVKNHEATTSVTLKAGQTKAVALNFATVGGPMQVQTITDDIDPLGTIADDINPMGIILGTALWGD